MIPHILHYCWFGGAPLPPLAEDCMASWRRYMPDWQYMRWDETTLTQALNSAYPQERFYDRPQDAQSGDALHPKGKGRERSWLEFMPTYVKQAYEARKFAFVSDYVRLWALEQYGGLYMDVDFLVHRPFDGLMEQYAAFAGYEGSKRQPIMQGVIASEPHGAWVQDMLVTYNDRSFVKPDGSLDFTPNTTFFSDRLEAQGFVPDGVEKDIYVDGTFFLHVLPVWAFCPGLTTGEDVRTPETYCEHMGISSWNSKDTWKMRFMRLLSPQWRTRLIKLKRKIWK